MAQPAGVGAGLQGPHPTVAAAGDALTFIFYAEFGAMTPIRGKRAPDLGFF